MRRLAVLLPLLLLTSRSLGGAASLEVEVRSGGGKAISDAVIYAIPESGEVPPPTGLAVMDQVDRRFVPHVLAVQAGTAVSFPNSDDVRHQVYSFSPAKRFQIPLYGGNPPPPVVFDVSGVVALGCNIHDRMRAYVVVVDTPFFAVTREGRAELSSLPAGSYRIHLWRGGSRQGAELHSVTLADTEHLHLELTAGSD